MADQPKCKGCGGWGRGVVKSDGLCDHCRRSGNGAGVAPVPGQKRPRPSDNEDGRSAKLAPKQISDEELQRMLEAADASDMPELDTVGIKKMLLTLEKRISANIDQRSKHTDNPQGYLDSEVALDSAIKQLQALAAVPQEYTTLVRSDSLLSLLGLLTHDNTDIAIDVLQLLNELLKDDVVAEAPEAGQALAQALLDKGGAELLVAALCRLDDAANADDALGMFSCLELFLSMVELLGGEAAVALAAVEGKGLKVKVPALLDFLLGRIMRKDLDDVKSASAELLTVLLSSDSRVSSILGSGTFVYTSAKGVPVQVDGIEYLLQLVNGFKKKQPDQLSSADKEVVENVMDALASAMLLPANHARFLAAEGFDLLLRAVHENGFARAGSLRCLDFAVANDPAGALALVEAGGLKAVFPAFMGKGLVQTRKWHDKEAAEVEEERGVSSVASLVQSFLPLVAVSAAGSAASAGAGADIDPKQARTALLRVLAKFAEASAEKIDRLLELRAKYSSKVEAGTGDDADNDEDEDEDEEVKEELAYLKRMRAGLFTLQRIDLTLARLLTLPERLSTSSGGGPGAVAGAVPDEAQDALARQLAFAARQKMYEQGASIVSLLETIEEYLKRLPEPDDATDGLGADAVAAGRDGRSSAAVNNDTEAISSRARAKAERTEIVWLIQALQEAAGLSTTT